MTHLTPDEFVDAAEGTLARERQAHLDACSVCRREAASLAALLREATEATVPEPSPLFWDLFSARVRAAVAEAPAETAPRWRRWPALAPLAGLAGLLVAAFWWWPVMPPAQPGSDVALVSPIDAAPADAAMEWPADGEGWAVVAELVGPLDWDTADAAGLSVGPGDAERAILDLTADEQLELRRLLATELERTKS